MSAECIFYTLGGYNFVKTRPKALSKTNLEAEGLGLLKVSVPEVYMRAAGDYGTARALRKWLDIAISKLMRRVFKQYPQFTPSFSAELPFSHKVLMGWGFKGLVLYADTCSSEEALQEEFVYSVLDNAKPCMRTLASQFQQAEAAYEYFYVCSFFKWVESIRHIMTPAHHIVDTYSLTAEQLVSGVQKGVISAGDLTEMVGLVTNNDMKPWMDLAVNAICAFSADALLHYHMLMCSQWPVEPWGGHSIQYFHEVWGIKGDLPYRFEDFINLTTQTMRSGPAALMRFAALRMLSHVYSEYLDNPDEKHKEKLEQAKALARNMAEASLPLIRFEKQWQTCAAPF